MQMFRVSTAPMSFSKPPVSFSLNIASSFSVMTHKSSVIFSSMLYALDKKSI